MSTATANYTQEVANTIRSQIEVGVFMSLGAHNLRHGSIAASKDAPALPSLIFNARILPFNKKGTRSGMPRVMQVVISLNAADYYDITVTHNQHGDRYGLKEPVTHFSAQDVDCGNLSRVLLALDYDGDEVLNPRLVAA